MYKSINYNYTLSMLYSKFSNINNMTKNTQKPNSK